MHATSPTEIAARLPPTLKLGAATSAYQIEGAVDADGRGTANWDTFAAKPGAVVDGSSGAGACDHYRHMPADVALMADLGLDTYRFSVAWPRILPRGSGPVEQRGLAFYDRLVDTLLSHGIEPVPTLYHWDLPQPLEDVGGWPHRDTAGRFADYATVVVEALGDRVTRWSTLNEPWCSAHLGYHAGQHAPGVTDPAQAMDAAYTLLRAHHLGTQAIRAASGAARVGVVLNLTTIDGDDEEAIRALDAIRNRWWLDGCIDGRIPDDAATAWAQVSPPDMRPEDLAAGRPDWLGINYYYPEKVTTGPAGAPLPDACVAPARSVPPTGELTAMGWPVDPGALTRLLRRVSDGWGPLPIAITENGAAYDDDPPQDGRVTDPRRTAFLSQHLTAVADAADGGVEVTDYMVWSLLDNFEWSFGYTKRFGIVAVDYDTQVRTPKDSARWYAAVIARQEAELV